MEEMESSIKLMINKFGVLKTKLKSLGEMSDTFGSSIPDLEAYF